MEQLNPRSLWEILIAADDAQTTPLTCGDCFRLLQYLANVAAAGADPQELRQALKRHLARCPSDCSEYFARRLAELEARRAWDDGPPAGRLH
jgi:hypothetical protein